MLVFAILQFLSERAKDLRKKRAEAKKRKGDEETRLKPSGADLEKTEPDTQKLGIQVDVKPAPVDIDADVATPIGDEKRGSSLLDATPTPAAKAEA